MRTSAVSPPRGRRTEALSGPRIVGQQARAVFSRVSKDRPLGFANGAMPDVNEGIPCAVLWEWTCAFTAWHHQPRREPRSAIRSRHDRHPPPGGTSPQMPSPRVRQHNVTAAQWSVNGSALGSPDLTVSGNEVFGTERVQPRRAAPAAAQARLQGAAGGRSTRGEALDTVAGRRRRAGDEGLGDGEGRDPLHALVPAADRTRRPRSTTPSTGRPATARRSPSSPARSSSRASPTRRASRPAASARRSRRAATPPGTRPRRPSSSRTPTARCCASRPRSPRGPARRSTTRSRCCARWTRCRGAADRAR